MTKLSLKIDSCNQGFGIRHTQYRHNDVNTFTKVFSSNFCFQTHRKVERLARWTPGIPATRFSNSTTLLKYSKWAKRTHNYCPLQFHQVPIWAAVRGWQESSYEQELPHCGTVGFVLLKSLEPCTKNLGQVKEKQANVCVLGLSMWVCAVGSKVLFFSNKIRSMF